MSEAVELILLFLSDAIRGIALFSLSIGFIIAILYFLFGLTLNFNKNLLQIRKQQLTKIISFCEAHKWAFPSLISSYIVFTLVMSISIIIDFNKTHGEEYKYWLNRPVSRFWSRDSYQKTFPQNTYIEKTDTYIFYFDPKISNKIYDESKYLKIKVWNYEIKKEMPEYDKLELYIKNLNELKNLYYFRSISKQDPILSSAAKRLEALKETSLAKSLEVLSKTSLKKTINEEPYFSQPYIVVTGYLKNNRIITNIPNLKISTSYVESVPSFPVVFLLQVNKYSHSNNLHTFDTEIISAWLTRGTF